MESGTIPQKVGDRPKIRDLNRYVMTELGGACVQNPGAWKKVGLELMPDSNAALNIIEVNNHGNVISCCSSLFDLWLQRTPHASWEHLIEALNNVNLDDLAAKIEGMLQSSADSTHKIETAKPQLQTATASGSSDHGSVLAQKVEMHKLNKTVIPKIKAHWQKLAEAMEYDIGEVAAFEMDGRGLEGGCKKMFTNWLTTGHGPTPKTYETLLKYIKEVDDLTVASEEIEKKLIEALSVKRD